MAQVPSLDGTHKPQGTAKKRSGERACDCWSKFQVQRIQVKETTGKKKKKTKSGIGIKNKRDHEEWMLAEMTNINACTP